MYFLHCGIDFLHKQNDCGPISPLTEYCFDIRKTFYFCFKFSMLYYINSTLHEKGFARLA